jgi:hypothetical protein
MNPNTLAQQNRDQYKNRRISQNNEKKKNHGSQNVGGD